MKYPLLILLSVTLAALFFSTAASARPEYAERIGQPCTACHAGPEGGALNRTGLDFSASGNVWPPTKSGYRILTPIKRSVRFFVGYLHMLAAFMWLGTILYVHILLRPGYASKGLPKGEVILGLSAMAVVGITGALLTISRISDISVLYGTRWGLLLLLKMLIYLTMVTSAAVVVTVVGPRLKRAKRNLSPPSDGLFDPTTLAAFDGEAGRQALVAYNGNVYDVTGMMLWPEGKHMRLHSAGSDLTDALARAPHGAGTIEACPKVGTYDAARQPPKEPGAEGLLLHRLHEPRARLLRPLRRRLMEMGGITLRKPQKEKRMKKTMLAVLSVLLVALPASAAEGMIDVESAFGVVETADRMERILKKKGMTVFGRVRHSEAAGKVGIELRDTELIIFGNPKVGSPLMSCAQSVAIDLPQKALIWSDDKARVWISYNDPGYLKKRHNISGCEGVISKIGSALAGIARSASTK